VLEVEAREGAEVQHAAAQPAEIGERTPRRRRIQVLQHVVTDQQVKRRWAAVRLDPTALPTIAPAQVLAALQCHVVRPRQQASQRRAQHAGATARFQDAPYRQPQVLGERGDEARPRLHFAARGDRGARIEVVALVVLAAETHR
jgi:hypothetical protein